MQQHLRASEERGGAEEGSAVEQIEVARAQLRRLRQSLRCAEVRRDSEPHALEDLCHLRPGLRCLAEPFDRRGEGGESGAAGLA